ncbi:MAG: acyl-CoA synthetase [Myxococcota bacterium]|nr:acyl-CoA synthetase [Myxococcota bacterium]
MADHGFWSYANRDAEALALVDPEERSWTRGELHAACNRIVGALREIGLQRGDAVALDSPNCAEFFAVYLACTQAGYYLVPINWHLAPPEVAYIVQDSEAKAFIGHERLAEVCVKAADEIDFPSEARLAIGEIAGFRSLEEAMSGHSPDAPEDRSAGAVMNYTSGTTGRPKGVKRDLAPAELEPDLIMGLFGGFLGMFGVEAGGDGVYICGSPLYHTAVLLQSAAALHWGHPVVLMDKWEPEEMLRLIEKYRCTTSHMVPTQFHRLLLLPEERRSKYDVSSTRHMLHAAAPCPPEIKRRMIEWWGESIWEYYAATEGGGTMVAAADWLEHPGTVGKAWPNAEIRIFDDDGKALPQGEIGTVYILMMDQAKFEYKDDAEKTRKNRIVADDGLVFFTAGDVGYLDPDGYLFLCDRKIDMIISGGANIYPAEIENELLNHPKVGDVAVFGIPNEDWGEEIKAVIEPAPGVEAGDDLTQDIMAFCQERLARFKQPRSIDYTHEMPRDPNGKLYKRKLRDPYWEGHERAI